MIEPNGNEILKFNDPIIPKAVYQIESTGGTYWIKVSTENILDTPNIGETLDKRIFGYKLSDASNTTLAIF